jgi:predicted ArsR family transcriptional regulator
MAPTSHGSVYDGTTGRSDRSGRRTHIIQLLRDSRVPLSVSEIAKKVGIHVNTARFHLESLVDAGLAERMTEPRSQPGRPKVVYSGSLPNQTHERAQGYRLLAEMLATAIAKADPSAGQWMYSVGREWGRYLTTKPAPFEETDEAEIDQRLIDKLDALWFGPELIPGEPPCLALHNCPFADSAKRYPGVVCQLHSGMINGSLEEMRSANRLVSITPWAEEHTCIGKLGPAADGELERIEITPREPPEATDAP